MSKQVVSSCLILAIGLLGCTLNRNTGGKNREIPQYRVENSMNTETAWMDITKYSTEAAKLPKYRKSQCPPSLMFSHFSLMKELEVCIMKICVGEGGCWEAAIFRTWEDWTRGHMYCALRFGCRCIYCCYKRRITSSTFLKILNYKRYKVCSAWWVISSDIV